MDYTNLISLILAIIGTAIAIYQTGVLNESKQRRCELQFLLAGIHSSALQKQQGWQNQMALLGTPNNESEIQLLKTHVRARDDFADIAQLTVALEGSIDIDSSAINGMMDKALSAIKKNNELQAEALRNPTLKNQEKAHA